MLLEGTSDRVPCRRIVELLREYSQVVAATSGHNEAANSQAFRAATVGTSRIAANPFEG